jgi:hypothetical protein
MDLELYDRLYPFLETSLSTNLEAPIAQYAAKVMSNRFTSKGVSVPELEKDVHDISDTLTTIETLREDGNDRLAAIVGKAQGDYFLVMLSVFPDRYIARQMKKGAPPILFYDRLAAKAYEYATRIAQESERDAVEHLSDVRSFRETRRNINSVLCVNSQDPQVVVQRFLLEAQNLH